MNNLTREDWRSVVHTFKASSLILAGQRNKGKSTFLSLLRIAIWATKLSDEIHSVPSDHWSTEQKRGPKRKAPIVEEEPEKE